MKTASYQCTAIVFALLSLTLMAGVASAETVAVPFESPALEQLFTPAPEVRVPICQCEMGHTTSLGSGYPSHAGFGGNCTAAKANLRSQLELAAMSSCEFDACSVVVVHTSACYVTKTGTTGIDGYANYGCWIYTGGCMLP